MKKQIFVVLIIVMLNFSGICFAKEEQNSSNNISRKVFEEIMRGSISGKIGVYYEHVHYDKDFFVEDDEIVNLNDNDLIVPYFQIDYMTPQYYGFGIGVGLTGYTHYNGEQNGENTIDELDKLIIHELYLKYERSNTILKIGRQELENTVFLSDYYEALSLSEEMENLFFIFTLVKEVADSDISKIIEFQNINRGDDSIDDYLFIVESTWDVFPDAAAITLYYYHQGNLYDLFGTHVELFHETGEIGLRLNVDIYATEEDSTNGLRDLKDKVKNSSIYHINPSVEINDFTFLQDISSVR